MSAMWHPTDGTWKAIVLLDGTQVNGPLTFTAHGAIGAYPAFVVGNRWIPLHAVREARR